jgi:hypothetical protein
MIFQWDKVYSCSALLISFIFDVNSENFARTVQDLNGIRWMKQDFNRAIFPKIWFSPMPGQLLNLCSHIRLGPIQVLKYFELFSAGSSRPHSHLPTPRWEASAGTWHRALPHHPQLVPYSHNTSFPSKLTNGPNKLVLFLAWQAFPGLV